MRKQEALALAEPLCEVSPDLEIGGSGGGGSAPAASSTSRAKEAPLDLHLPSKSCAGYSRGSEQEVFRYHQGVKGLRSGSTRCEVQ